MPLYLDLAFVTFIGYLTERERERDVSYCARQYTQCRRAAESAWFHRINLFALAMLEMLSNSEEQPLIYCFPWTPQRAGRREKPHYKEHRSSIGKKYGKQRMPLNCLSQSRWLLSQGQKQGRLGCLPTIACKCPLQFFYLFF